MKPATPHLDFLCPTVLQVTKPPNTARSNNNISRFKSCYNHTLSSQITLLTKPAYPTPPSPSLQTSPSKPPSHPSQQPPDPLTALPYPQKSYQQQQSRSLSGSLRFPTITSVSQFNTTSLDPSIMRVSDLHGPWQKPPSPYPLCLPPFPPGYASRTPPPASGLYSRWCFGLTGRLCSTCGPVPRWSWVYDRLAALLGRAVRPRC